MVDRNQDPDTEDPETFSQNLIGISVYLDTATAEAALKRPASSRPYPDVEVSVSNVGILPYEPLFTLRKHPMVEKGGMSPVLSNLNLVPLTTAEQALDVEGKAKAVLNKIRFVGFNRDKDVQMPPSGPRPPAATLSTTAAISGAVSVTRTHYGRMPIGTVVEVYVPTQDEVKNDPYRTSYTQTQRHKPILRTRPMDPAKGFVPTLLEVCQGFGIFTVAKMADDEEDITAESVSQKLLEQTIETSLEDPRFFALFTNFENAIRSFGIGVVMRGAEAGPGKKYVISM